VLRLLDKTESKFTLEGLGMSGEVLTAFPPGAAAARHRARHRPHRLGQDDHAVREPGRVDTSTTNVLTVEDPVEYELPGIGQTQVNPKIDLTFAKALRAILRQDPDVIMIGEIRDFETAQIAIQASAHRPPGAGHAAHQRRTVSCGHPADRHGRGALPAVVQPAGRAGAAPGAQAVPGLQAAGRTRPLAPGGLPRLRHAATRAAPASTS
jgi:hypothetical protein